MPEMGQTNMSGAMRNRGWIAADARRGMTLVESVVAIVIAGVMLVAALNTMAGAVQARHVRSSQGLAKILAHELMSEVVLTFYEESSIKADQTITKLDGATVIVLQPVAAQSPVFGPETGEVDGTRLNFDDIDDYNGWQSTPPVTKYGVPLTDCAGWTRKVAIQFADLATGVGTGTLTETGMKLIRVEVFDPDGVAQASVEALRSKVGGFENPPTVTTDYVNWVGIELQATGSTSAINAGAASVNQTP